MTPDRVGVILKRFEDPDEVREMEKGRFEIVRIGGESRGSGVEDRRERNLFEAGFYGLSVIFAIVAGLMALFVLAFLVIHGTLEAYPLALCAGALAASGCFRLFSRLMRD